MGKSKLRKGHKNKVKKYLETKKTAEKKARKILMEQFLAQQEEFAKTIDAQKAGADVENTDIEVDVDIDDMDLDMSVGDEVEDVQDAEIVEEKEQK